MQAFGDDLGSREGSESYRVDDVLVLLLEGDCGVGVLPVCAPAEDVFSIPGRSQHGALLIDRHIDHPVFMTLQSCNAEPSGSVPHFDRFVPTGRDDVGATRREDDGGHVVLVTLQSLGAFHRLHVPYFDNHIFSTGCQQVACSVE